MKSAYGLPKKRDEVINALQTAYTDGNLDEQDYENRLTEVYKAQDLGELEKVIDDFPFTIKYKIFPRDSQNNSDKTSVQSNQRGQSSMANGQSQRRPLPMQNKRVLMSDQTFALQVFEAGSMLFSNLLGTQRIDAERAIVNTSSCVMHVECLLGSTKINLVNPNLAGKEVNLHLHGALGEVKIKVPPGTRVSRPIQMLASEFSFKKSRNYLASVFGSQKRPQVEDMSFHLVIHGNFFLGSVKVTY